MAMPTSERPFAPRRASSLALVLGPVVAIVLVSVALSVVLVTRHVRQIRTGLIDRARTIAQFMTRDAVVSLLSLDNVMLRHLVALAVIQEDVVYAAIHDADGEIVALRGEAPPPATVLGPARLIDGRGLQLFTSPAGWELRAPLYVSALESEREADLSDDGESYRPGTRKRIGQVRLGLSHTTLDRERRMAILTATMFTTFVTVLAAAGAVVFMRRHLATLMAGAALAEEHERVADLKARIVTQTSHEFRTPLAVIVAASDVLQRYGDRLTIEERTSRLEKIRTAVHQMTDLLDDVLLFGRTEASRFTPEPFDLVALCAAAVEQARHALPATLQLVAVLPTTPITAAVDPFLLGQVLRGLLTNAVRYSPNGGTIMLRLDVDAQHGVTVTIADEGIGIPADDLPRLFEPFQRASNVGKIVGSGLGLAIAKRAIDVHGGEIAVRSVADAGSTFTITLPATCLRPASHSVAA
jgi:signal transduction histidine kinase